MSEVLLVLWVGGYGGNNFSALGSYIQVKLLSGNTSPRRIPSSSSDVGW